VTQASRPDIRQHPRGGRDELEVCSQGFVLLTGTQLAGSAIAVAGIGSLAFAIVLAWR
jgi:hypothetical protein